MDGHAHNLAGLYEVAGDLDVLAAGFGIAGGMIMRQNQRGALARMAVLKIYRGSPIEAARPPTLISERPITLMSISVRYVLICRQRQRLMSTTL